jgi:hypothetical protein
VDHRVASLIVGSAPPRVPEQLLLAAYILRSARDDFHIDLMLVDQTAVPGALARRVDDLRLERTVSVAPATDLRALRSLCGDADIVVIAAGDLGPEWTWLARLARSRPLIVGRGLVLPGLKTRPGNVVDFWDPRQVAHVIGRQIDAPHAPPSRLGKLAPWQLGHGEAVLRHHSRGI